MACDVEKIRGLEDRVKFLEEVVLRMLGEGGPFISLAHVLAKLTDKIAELDELV
jgi:hypothetical protein